MGLFDFIFGSRSKRKGGKSDANGYQNVGKDSGNSSQTSNSQTQSISLKFNQIIKEEGLVCCYCSTLNKVCDNSILLFHQFSEYVDEDEKNEIMISNIQNRIEKDVDNGLHIQISEASSYCRLCGCYEGGRAEGAAHSKGD